MTSSHSQANVALVAEDAAAAGHIMPVPASPLSREDVIQREMQHLREMVFALSLEVAAKKAARGQLQMTVDALEGRDDPGEGAEIRSQGGDSPYALLLGRTDGDEIFCAGSCGRCAMFAHSR